MKPSSNIDISVLLADILSVPSMYYLYVRYLCQETCLRLTLCLNMYTYTYAYMCMLCCICSAFVGNFITYGNVNN